jgi:hypothetical protein
MHGRSWFTYTRPGTELTCSDGDVPIPLFVYHPDLASCESGDEGVLPRPMLSHLVSFPLRRML